MPWKRRVAPAPAGRATLTSFCLANNAFWALENDIRSESKQSFPFVRTGKTNGTCVNRAQVRSLFGWKNNGYRQGHGRPHRPLSRLVRRLPPGHAPRLRRHSGTHSTGSTTSILNLPSPWTSPQMCPRRPRSSLPGGMPGPPSCSPRSVSSPWSVRPLPAQHGVSQPAARRRVGPVACAGHWNVGGKDILPGLSLGRWFEPAGQSPETPAEPPASAQTREKGPPLCLCS